MRLGSWKVSVRTRLGTVKCFPPTLPERLQNQPNLMVKEVSLNKILCAFFWSSHTQPSPSQVTALDLSRKYNVARFNVLTAMLTFPFFLGMIQFILVYACQCLGRVFCFYLQGSPTTVGIPPELIGIGCPRDRIVGLARNRRYQVSRKRRCLYTIQPPYRGGCFNTRPARDNYNKLVTGTIL
jgi:hypothetical protein